MLISTGGGGGPLPARLAVAGHRLLLLEAGDGRGADISEQVPAFHGYVIDNAWGHRFLYMSNWARWGSKCGARFEFQSERS